MMTDPDLQDHLDPGEILQASFLPEFSIYLKREAVVLALSLLLVAPVALLTRDPRVLAAVPLLLLFDFVVDDTLTEWQRIRRLRWLLTDRRLIEVDTADPTATRSLPIGKIARLRRILFWRLFVVAEDRSIVTLVYVPGVAQLLARLTALREAVK